ncbi:cupin domain-containing protein [Dyella sp. 20L07]|uniref:cupin domain-containing protein n=1 Tax=Dyella sp. 20L07 TaxID=3384240 RepID=UPI003D2C272F
MASRLTPDTALAALAQVDTPYLTLFRHGSMEVEVYRPMGVDGQSPHRRDELYVVIAGYGHFVCGNERRPFQAGEVLFVPAGVVHRFEDFSEDFSTWVIFYGPDGGEAS